MNWEFPIHAPITALASSSPDHRRGAELSIVSVLNGEIGDPVTWIDEPDDGRADCASTHGAGLFKAVAEDIGAHLPMGFVVIRRPDPALALLRQVLPPWRPALVVDALDLVAPTPRTAGHVQGVRYGMTDPTAEVALGTTADRAVAVARLLLDLLGLTTSTVAT